MSLLGLLIIVIVFGLIYMVVGMLPLPEPFKRIATVIVLVVGLLYLLGALFGGVSVPVIRLQ